VHLEAEQVGEQQLEPVAVNLALDRRDEHTVVEVLLQPVDVVDRLLLDRPLLAKQMGETIEAGRQAVAASKAGSAGAGSGLAERPPADAARV
jgi:hypothetical protein